MTNKERVQKVMHEAFAPIHDTPDGKFCWWGRLDRAYRLAAQEPDRYAEAVKTLQAKFSAVLKEYKQLSESYQGDDLGYVECKCEYCTRQPTFGGVNLNGTSKTG